MKVSRAKCMFWSLGEGSTVSHRSSVRFFSSEIIRYEGRFGQ